VTGAGEVAVIAGASGAIGSALVDRLLAEGGTVIGVLRDADRVPGRWRPEARFELCVGDVTSPQLVDEVAAVVAGRPVRLLANLAKTTEQGRLSVVPPERLALGVDAKAGGLLRLVRACEAELLRGARVIGFGGRLGYDPDPGAPTTSVANAALANLVRQLARELGPRGVTAHVIAPGAVDGPDRSRPVEGGLSRRDQLAARTPIGRLPSAEEVVDATLALLGVAGDLLNGGSLLLDGGQRTSIP
jgi:NAD(P)-dependent dehydrogenase (short-subunit alcohol dehydrogenase family)